MRLGDLWHFRRGRETFKRGDEHGVAFGGPAGRLVELRQRLRLQFEAARLLGLRDGDGGEEGFLGGGCVRRIAF
jgi:hypothetical protein